MIKFIKIIYFAIITICLVSCLSKPPVPVNRHKGKNPSSSDIQHNKIPSSKNITPNNQNPTSSIEQKTPEITDLLGEIEAPIQVKKWIKSNVLSKYDKVTIQWINDYTIQINASKASETAVYTYGDSASIIRMYGRHAKYHSLKYDLELEKKVRKLLKNDTIYQKIIQVAKRSCEEIQYDWSNFTNYKGHIPSKTSDKRLCVCEGYADEVCEQFIKIPGITSIEKWHGANHAWNVINLENGRQLYVDLCWFDNETIDERTGRIIELDDYNWRNITYDKDEFTYAGIGYGTYQYCHAYGRKYK